MQENDLSEARRYYRPETERGSELCDVARQPMELVEGFRLRFCDCFNTWLNWQAGVIVTRSLNYRARSMTRPVCATVDYFHLLGYGATREEALQMARERTGRNGV